MLQTVMLIDTCNTIAPRAPVTSSICNPQNTGYVASNRQQRNDFSISPTINNVNHGFDNLFSNLSALAKYEPVSGRAK